MKKSVLISLHAFVLLSNYIIYLAFIYHFNYKIPYPNAATPYEIGFNLGYTQGAVIHYISLFIWFYLGYFLIANKFLKAKKQLRFIISVFTIILIIYIVLNLGHIFKNGWNVLILKDNLLSILTVIFFFLNGFLFRIFVEWFNNQQKKKDLENEMLKTKMLLLTSQNNPHFIFNVLNNIDSLINTKPAKASEAICKFSDILRYIYSNTETDKVLLTSEIKYIEDYIELQKLRLNSDIHVQLKKDNLPGEIKVIPMLFIPFIENAFKHGIINKNNPLEIKISYHDNQLYFECSNSYDINEDNAKTESGLGIINVTKRLDLMYPKQYDLNIKKENGLYSVLLTLQIDED